MKTNEQSVIRRIKYAADRGHSIGIKDTILELNARGSEPISDTARRFSEKSGTDWIYFQNDCEFRFYR